MNLGDQYIEVRSKQQL